MVVEPKVISAITGKNTDKTHKNMYNPQANNTPPTGSSKPVGDKKIPMKLRVFLGIVSLPSFILFCMLEATALQGDSNTIGIMETIYALVGVGALFIALSGKRPL